MYAAMLAAMMMTASNADADSAGTDKAVYDALKELNNRGADLNKEDSIGCYRMYQGGLIVIKAMLAHRPAAQKIIDDGMKKAEQLQPYQRAFSLHTTITELRATLKPVATTLPPPSPVNPSTPVTPNIGSPAGGEATKVPPPSSFPPPVVPKTTLWDRLGGEEKVKKAVDEWVTAALADPKVDMTRGGLLKLDGEALATCKLRLVGHLSNLSEGSVPSAVKTLTDAHAGIPIAGEPFAAFIGHLKKALANRGVASADVDAIAKKVQDAK